MIAYPPERNSSTTATKRCTVLFFLKTILLLLAFEAGAQTTGSVTLAWNTDPSPGLAGYRLYQGVASGVYTNQLAVGNKTNATISGLVTGVKYFFAVTAYTTTGLESPFSNEVSYTPSTNSLPGIVLTAPASGASYVAPAQINLAAGVSTNGHKINKVQFFNGAALLAEAANPPYAFTWNNVGLGSYQLLAQLVYDSTNRIASATANVTVTVTPSTTPPAAVTFSSTSGAITAPFVASNGIVYQPNETSLTNGGQAVYPFTIAAAGSYVVSAMTIAPTTAANSFFVNIDAQPTDPTMIWDVPLSTNLASSLVCWRGNTNSTGVPGADQFSPKVFNLATGAHQLIVRGREANTQLGTITISPTNSTTPPLIVLTSPNNNSTYSAPANLTLAATLTPNGHTISKVQFFNGAALLGESLTAPYSVSWGNVGAGNYSLTASAIYDSNSTLSTAVTTVSVTNPVPPSTSFAASSGTITSPFVVSNGFVFQPVDTWLTGAGSAVYNFTVPSTGDYLISAMVIAPSGGANSFYVNIDAQPTDPYMIWDLGITTNATSQTVCWRGSINSTGVPGADQFSPKVFNLTQGSHQLIILGREGYTQLGTITISPANVLPPPWQVLDIGNTGITGNASVSSGAYRVSAAGNLSGSSDNFRFLYQPMTGDGDLRARFASLQNTTTTGSAGVMIRETLTAASKYAFLGILPDGTVRSQNRASTASGSSAVNSGSLALPNAWARLVRSNNSILAYKSSDGVNWTLADSNSIVLATNIYFGLAVASGTNNSWSTATFTNVVAVP